MTNNHQTESTIVLCRYQLW